MLFPALLPHLLLFLRYIPLGNGLRAGDIHRGFHRRHRADAKRGRTLAFRREDHAHPLWRGLKRRIVFRIDSPHRADPPRAAAWHLRMDGAGADKEEANRERQETELTQEQLNTLFNNQKL